MGGIYWPDVERLASQERRILLHAVDYLITLSVFQTMQWRMVGWLMNKDLEGVSEGMGHGLLWIVVVVVKGVSKILGMDRVREVVKSGVAVIKRPRTAVLDWVRREPAEQCRAARLVSPSTSTNLAVHTDKRCLELCWDVKRRACKSRADR